MKTRLSGTTCLFSLLLATSSAVWAETTACGEHTVHHIAVNSTFIKPEIARQYGIVRAPRNAFLNISVLHNEADGGTTPVTATLSGSRSNLMQQSSLIKFREVREGDAIYYIGEFEFSNAELLRFRVEVQPEGTERSCLLEWTTTLYAG